MKTLNIRPTRRRVFFITLVALLLSSLVVVCGFASGVAWSSATASSNVTQSGDGKEEFDDDDLKEEKVRGKWQAGLVSDMSQFNDPSLPAVVSGIQSLSGGGRYSGITKIKKVKITNRSSKVVNSVRLRWTVANLNEPEKVLSEGVTPSIEVWVEASSTQTVGVPTMYHGRMLKPLAKSGELYGQFLITIGLQEAGFTDGSFWRRQEPVAHLKFLYPNESLDDRFPALASITSGIIHPPANSSNSQLKITQCEAMPRLTASAFLMPFRQTYCRDNMTTWV